VEVWFEDEARFGQQGTLTRMWAKRGSRPRAVRQTQYDYLYVLGAVCPGSGQSVGLLAPHLDTGVVNVFLDLFARELQPGVHAVMIWDQAGFHTANDLNVPPNITLIELPPYSPELNPIENLWHYLRSHHWSNRSYEDYLHLRQAAVDAWQTTGLNASLLQTVCATPCLQNAVDWDEAYQRTFAAPC
jgi:transposase